MVQALSRVREGHKEQLNQTSRTCSDWAILDQTSAFASIRARSAPCAPYVD